MGVVEVMCSGSTCVEVQLINEVLADGRIVAVEKHMHTALHAARSNCITQHRQRVQNVALFHCGKHPYLASSVVDCEVGDDEDGAGGARGGGRE